MSMDLIREREREGALLEWGGGLMDRGLFLEYNGVA